MAQNVKTDLDTISASIASVFPKLDVFEQRLSIELYRLLAAGHPVSAASLAARLEVSVQTVRQIIDRWPGVFFDSPKRVVGYCGLSIADFYSSPHRLTVDGKTLSAWCAWDTLFIPELIARETLVESTSPTSRLTIHLLVTPEGVRCVEPADAQVSFVLPDAAAVEKNIVTAFCDFVHFFPSREAGQIWVQQHPEALILSIDEAHEVGRQRNRKQYGAVL
jgi:alkylmercury lyase